MVWENMTERSHVLAGEGYALIHMRIEECFMWVRNQGKQYSTHEDLALDFGVRGTRSFFPLSLLINEISKDVRFGKYVEQKQ